MFNKKAKNDHLKHTFQSVTKAPKQSSAPLISLYFIYHTEVIKHEELNELF
jgi:hypothetical protein